MTKKVTIFPLNFHQIVTSIFKVKKKKLDDDSEEKIFFFGKQMTVIFFMYKNQNHEFLCKKSIIEP
jgi:hypothetical protein